MTELACPKCSERLHSPQDTDAPLRTCHACAGAWVDATGLRSAIHDLSELRKAVEESGVRTELECPACASERLIEVKLGDCPLDVCGTCEGVFFDRGEWEALRLARSEGGGTMEKVTDVKDLIVGELIIEGVCSLISAAGEALG